MDSTPPFHPSDVARLLRVLAERICSAGVETVAERLVVGHQTDHEVEQVPHVCLVLDRSAKERSLVARTCAERASTSARLVFQAKRSSQPAGTGCGGSATTCRSSDRPSGCSPPSRRRPLALRGSSGARRPSTCRPLDCRSPTSTGPTKPSAGTPTISALAGPRSLGPNPGRRW